MEREHLCNHSCLFSPLLCFLFFAPSSHQLLPHLLYIFHCSCTTLINFLLSHLLCIRSSPLAFLCRLFICPISSSSPSLSQITLNVAQGRVQSPSLQPRYKSYAYTQAAYVKSPEKKRRRFTDQVRVSQS